MEEKFGVFSSGGESRILPLAANYRLHAKINVARSRPLRRRVEEVAVEPGK